MNDPLCKENSFGKRGETRMYVLEAELKMDASQTVNG